MRIVAKARHDLVLRAPSDIKPPETGPVASLPSCATHLNAIFAADPVASCIARREYHFLWISERAI